MNESLSYQVPGAGVSTRDRTHTLFAQTMGYVAVTAGLFALGAYLGRNLADAVGIMDETLAGYDSLGTGQGPFYKELS